MSTLSSIGGMSACLRPLTPFSDGRARSILRWLLLLLVLAVCAQGIASAAHSTLAQGGEQGRTAQSGSGSDSGVFQVLADGRPIGTEKFRITRSNSGWEATGELQLKPPGGAAVTETSVLRLDSNLRPSSYERQQKSPQEGILTVKFSKEETLLISTTKEGTQEEGFYLPENFLVVLDTNLFHHYALMLRQYDRDRAGSQPFNVFIPQEALPGTIYLQFVGKESVAVGKATRELDHFQATSDEVRIEIWATPEGAIHRVSIPQASLEVVRQ